MPLCRQKTGRPCCGKKELCHVPGLLLMIGCFALAGRTSLAGWKEADRRRASVMVGGLNSFPVVALLGGDAGSDGGGVASGPLKARR